MEVREFQKADITQIAQLFHDTVHHVNSNDYSREQINAWAPDDIYFRNWTKECSRKNTFVAEKQHIITGFAELDDNGYIDCFYCHMDYQGRGVGKLLYQAIEEKAIELNLEKIYVDASITAKPFFKRMGFSPLRTQEVEIRGQRFVNHKMLKQL
ncbi:GNAT family N-acetyltransferase [Fodinibius halophilus]|uniref:GNAT family N-acetyltransferase n=1 Tax=Fodinibius halophilus TaxID=1736908 RepID=A0A6M1TAP6_9BACT|nr:GNAT family N-acetyltransferase [Fodinibius halophilus]NGP88044.1 GNAT family N-acetyltransferase [Fodinibius halophilus]